MFSLYIGSLRKGVSQQSESYIVKAQKKKKLSFSISGNKREGIVAMCANTIFLSNSPLKAQFVCLFRDKILHTIKIDQEAFC